MTSERNNYTTSKLYFAYYVRHNMHKSYCGLLSSEKMNVEDAKHYKCLKKPVKRMMEDLEFWKAHMALKKNIDKR